MEILFDPVIWHLEAPLNNKHTYVKLNPCLIGPRVTEPIWLDPRVT